MPQNPRFPGNIEVPVPFERNQGEVPSLFVRSDYHASPIALHEWLSVGSFNPLHSDGGTHSDLRSEEEVLSFPGDGGKTVAKESAARHTV